MTWTTMGLHGQAISMPWSFMGNRGIAMDDRGIASDVHG